MPLQLQVVTHTHLYVTSLVPDINIVLPLDHLAVHTPARRENVLHCDDLDVNDLPLLCHHLAGDPIVPDPPADHDHDGDHHEQGHLVHASDPLHLFNVQSQLPFTFPDSYTSIYTIILSFQSTRHGVFPISTILEKLAVLEIHP